MKYTKRDVRKAYDTYNDRQEICKLTVTLARCREDRAAILKALEAILPYADRKEDAAVGEKVIENSYRAIAKVKREED